MRILGCWFQRDFVLKEDEPADYFFILIKGQISLLLGDTGKSVYQSSGLEEMFGPEKEVGSLYDHPYRSKGEVKKKALREAQRVTAYIQKELFPVHGL